MTAEVQTLTCRELTEFLADYLAGELDPHQRSLFEKHVAECPECVVYLRSYTETIRLVGAVRGDDPVPASVPEKLVRAILRARERPPRSRPPGA